MRTYALVNATGLVENVTLWDGSSDWTPPEGLSAVRLTTVGVGIGWSYDGSAFSPPEPDPAPEPEPGPVRVTKARFGDLFTDDEHGRMNLIRWQCAQMDAEDRSVPNNPLTYAETLFRKFDLPAEYIELDLPMVADGLGLLGLLGVFGDNAPTRIAQILVNELPA